MNPDRIIIESSGSAFPATLAIQIRQLAPEGFSLDSVVTVIDCVNFAGYEDTSPTAKVRCLTLAAKMHPGKLMCVQIQAKYTDCLLLNKHDLCTERQLDTVLDHLYELNDETPVIRVSKDSPLDPALIFGLDTKLFTRGAEEVADWEAIGGGKNHVDEVETRSVWRGGGRPGAKKHAHDDACGCDAPDGAEEEDGPVTAVDEELLKTELAKLPFEIYRGKLP
jgi:G3E family GTPase